jgi:hypothetical protein
MTAAPIQSVSGPRPVPAIFWGGLLCGILDINSAFVAYYKFSR